MEVPPGTPPIESEVNIQDGEKSVEVKAKDFQLIKVPQSAVGGGRVGRGGGREGGRVGECMDVWFYPAKCIGAHVCGRDVHVYLYICHS